MDKTNLSSNWKRLQATISTSKDEGRTSKAATAQNGLKRKRSAPAPAIAAKRGLDCKKPRLVRSMENKNGPTSRDSTHRETSPRSNMSTSIAQANINAGLSPGVEIGKYVAIDCEMVGVGPEPDKESALARVSVVNFDGDQVYDSYVLPLEAVTDYRTHVSGIAARHMKVARPFKEVQTDVANIMKDRVIIGHSIHKDLEVLMISHPRQDVRDTARHPPFRKLAGGSWPRLQILASELLGVRIQEGEHSSTEDARACMMLFRKDKAAFEQEHSKRWPTRPSVAVAADEDGLSQPSRRKKKKKKRK